MRGQATTADEIIHAIPLGDGAMPGAPNGGGAHGASLVPTAGGPGGLGLFSTLIQQLGIGGSALAGQGSLPDLGTLENRSHVLMIVLVKLAPLQDCRSWNAWHWLSLMHAERHACVKSLL